MIVFFFYLVCGVCVMSWCVVRCWCSGYDVRLVLVLV